MNTTEQIKNNNQPLISIIIPVYKVEPYLRDCIDSCIQQTYKNIEIILVDDGSPDRCPAICDEYAKKDSRIRVLHKTNGGLSDARNEGMKIAKGEWWTFVDSDDVLHPQMIEILYDGILKFPDLLISACSYRRIDENFNSYNTIETTFFDYEINIFSDFIKRRLTLWVAAWNKLYHHSLFENIIFPVGRLYEDIFTTYKIMYKAQRIVYTKSNLYFYRNRTASITGRQTYRNITEKTDALVEELEFFKEKKDKDLIRTGILQILIYYINLFAKAYKHLKVKKYQKKLISIINQQDLSIFSPSERFKLSLKLHFPRSYRLFRDCKKRIKKWRNDRINYKSN